MKKIFLLLLCFFPLLCFAQGDKISKVTFLKYNNEIIISYYLNAGIMKNVRVYMNTQGKTRLLRNVSGDVGKVWGRGYKEVRFFVVDELGTDEIPEDATFTVSGKEHVYVPLYGAFEYNYSFSAPIGFGFAYFSKWGGYMRYKFSFISSEIQNTYFDYSANEAKKRYYRQSYTAGVVRMLYKNWIWVYGGLGYGIYAPVDKVPIHSDYVANYAEYFWAGEKVKGLELEIGLMFNLKGFFMSVGYGSIAGQKMPFWPNVSVGAGYILEF